MVVLPSEEAEARRYSSIVIDAQTGEVLNARHPHRKAYPASLTKIMTLYMVFEALETGRLKLDQRLIVSKRASRMPATKLGLRAGQKITVRNAILALVTKSANDVATVVAEALGGTESKFARLMTHKARELGMTRTTFRNASGLPNKGQLSTAADMAKLAQAIIRQFPRYYRYFSTKQFTYKGRVYPNHNKLLKSFSGTDGIKTGYTSASGYNLVASAVRKNRRLIAVVFGGRTGRSRDRKVSQLLDKGFAQVRQAGVPALVTPPARKPGVSVAVAAKDQPKSGPMSGDRVAAAVSERFTANNQMASLASGPQATPPELVAPASEPVAVPSTANSAVPRPPLYAAIPQRQTYESLQGAPGSPVPHPPRYAQIPARPISIAAQGSAGEASPPSALSAGLAGGFKLLVSPAQAAIPEDAWGIQVGAFRRIAPAQLAAREATRRIPKLLEESTMTIAPAKGQRGEIYRARLLGISERHARQACRALKRGGMSCMVVPPNQG